MTDQITRRTLLKGGSMIAVGLVAPRWLSTIAQADMMRVAQGGKASSDTVLVVCQFGGGNDGLNTVIPYADANYYKLRPTLGIPEAQALKLDEHMAFHPALQGLHTLYKEGKVAVLQNVGYPHPNRSHFQSMKIWQSASPDLTMRDGWLGRHLDQQMTLGPLNPVVALGLSQESPLALAAEKASVPCFASLQDLQHLVGDDDMQSMLRQMQAGASASSQMELVKNTTDNAINAASILSHEVQKYTPKETYGKDAFGQGFKQIAQLVATSPKTRVIYFSTGGFDTHANQLPTQQRLLQGFGDAMLAFQREMESLGMADKVVVLTFSEFGRRAYENGSGTDHGKAAPMFIVGKNVKGGLHGPNPDLQNLDAGDVVFNTDFRQVYAATLDTWIGGDSEVVLGEKFAPLPLFTV